VVGVGGGGGKADSDSHGGGGSGLMESLRAQLLDGTYYLKVKVGAGGKEGKGGKDTTVNWEETHLRAQGGEGGEGVKGGAGFSGGGAGGEQYGDGGKNGGNGCCGSSKGEGSGLDLSSIQLDTFSLSPGSKGNRYQTTIGKDGGGGGGVLVDGEAPDYSEFPSLDGQGYGGGGGYGAGCQGVVLMEIKAN